MFDKTWKWAGSFRKTEKTIGDAPFHIAANLKVLLDDIGCQFAHVDLSAEDVRVQRIDEIACIFHHRLVKIHPFPNGNGRHARLMTDLLLVQVGRPQFTWGNKGLEKAGAFRKQYIDALRKADGRDYTALFSFVRS